MGGETSHLVKSSAGGLAGDHAKPAATPVLVAPSTDGERNTIGVRLVPVACWRVDDMHFEFGSSFVRPDLRDELQALYKLIQAHPGAPLSIFGHADPIGQDESNKKLSGRRAQAIYALLTRNTELWKDLYTNPYQSDKWDTDEIQIMLSELHYYAGPVDGKNGELTKEAVKKFQGEHGLGVDGVAGPKTRPELYKAYMNIICVDGDKKPYKLDKKDFLAQGADKDGKGDYQGCGEFNPVLIFSQQEQQRFEQDQDKLERNTANEPNRRVMVLLFRKGSMVDPIKWPCPKVKESVAGCKKRFWSDGEQRRSTQLLDAPRKFEETKDTMACRFYHRHIVGSSWEKVYGRAIWITAIPEGVDENIFLLIRDEAGNEIARFKPDQAKPGPEQNWNFDLSQLDASVQLQLELYTGEKFIAPIVNLAINALRVSLDMENDEAAGASLFVAGPLAEPSDPLDESKPVDLSSEMYCPVIAPCQRTNLCE